jgi:hypothetical protein
MFVTEVLKDWSPIFSTIFNQGFYVELVILSGWANFWDHKIGKKFKSGPRVAIFATFYENSHKSNFSNLDEFKHFLPQPSCCQSAIFADFTEIRCSFNDNKKNKSKDSFK